MPSLKRSANPLDQVFQNLRDGNAALTSNCEGEIEVPFLAPDSAHAQGGKLGGRLPKLSPK